MSDWTWVEWLFGSLGFAAVIGAATWAWAHRGIAGKGGDGERR